MNTVTIAENYLHLHGEKVRANPQHKSRPPNNTGVRSVRDELKKDLTVSFSAFNRLCWDLVMHIFCIQNDYRIPTEHLSMLHHLSKYEKESYMYKDLHDTLKYLNISQQHCGNFAKVVTT